VSLQTTRGRPFIVIWNEHAFPKAIAWVFNGLSASGGAVFSPQALWLDENPLPFIGEVVVGNEIQWFSGLLKVPVECPENTRKTQFPCCVVFGSQFIESASLFFVVFRANPQSAAYLRPELP
jgi:hypothetical protein